MICSARVSVARMNTCMLSSSMINSGPQKVQRHFHATQLLLIRGIVELLLHPSSPPPTFPKLERPQVWGRPEEQGQLESSRAQEDWTTGSFACFPNQRNHAWEESSCPCSPHLPQTRMTLWWDRSEEAMGFWGNGASAGWSACTLPLRKISTTAHFPEVCSSRNECPWPLLGSMLDLSSLKAFILMLQKCRGGGGVEISL